MFVKHVCVCVCVSATMVNSLYFIRNFQWKCTFPANCICMCSLLNKRLQILIGQIHISLVEWLWAAAGGGGEKEEKELKFYDENNNRKLSYLKTMLIFYAIWIGVFVVVVVWMMLTTLLTNVIAVMIWLTSRNNGKEWMGTLVLYEWIPL